MRTLEQAIAEHNEQVRIKRLEKDHLLELAEEKRKLVEAERDLRLIGLRLAPSKTLRERLAALEHEQWMKWSQDLARNENISVRRKKRWALQWVPYDQLDEDNKEHDRVWADRVLEIISDAGKRENGPTKSA